MKLSVFAKKMGICYQTAWNWYKKGMIPGAYAVGTGTILVPDNVEELMKNVKNTSHSLQVDK